MSWSNERGKIRLRAEVFLKTEGACFYCGNRATTCDHIKPKSAGGKTNLTNLLPACLPCNERKRSLSLRTCRKRFGNFWGDLRGPTFVIVRQTTLALAAAAGK